MSDRDESIFKDIANINTFDLFSDSYLGLLVDNDSIFEFPSVTDHRIHHDDSLKFTIFKLFKEEKDKYFDLFHDKVKNLIPEYSCFLDSPELTYSFFLTSLNKIVYLNSSDSSFISGILFIPDDVSGLSLYQKEVLESIMKRLPNDNEDIRIATIPSIYEIMNDICYYSEYSINDYKEKDKKAKVS